MKKILIIIGGTLLIIGIGILVYFLFFTNNAHVVIQQHATRAVFPVASNSTAPSTIAGIKGSTVHSQKNITGAEEVAGSLPRLVQISKGPVVPSIFLLDLKRATTTTTATTTVAASTTPVIVQYIDQQNGNIYQYNSSTGKQTRISNKTIPGIHSATWLSDGSIAYVQYISHTGNGGDVSTYALTKNGIGGFFLPQGLSEVLTDGTKNILVVSSGENGSIVKKANKDASDVYTAFQTPLSAILVKVAGPKNYIVYTKPSAYIGGYVFLEHGDSGILTPIAGPQKGLTALVNHAGTSVLVSYINSSDKMQTELVSIKNKVVTKLPISTIADKCVWSQDDSSIYCGVPQNPTQEPYPDSWYQGTTSFTDQMWKINVAGRYAKFLFKFSKKEGSGLDAIALSVDKKQQVLSFVNKRTGALWAYRLQP